MSQAVSPSIDRVYGLARVTRCWNVSRATVYRHRQAPVVPKRRPGPVGPCDDATLLEHIKKAIAESRFTGEGYRGSWPVCAFRRPQLAWTGAPADAGEPPFSAAPDPQATGQGARRHHHHRGRGRPVGDRHDPERHPGRGRGPRLRCRRSLQQRMRRHPRRQERHRFQAWNRSARVCAGTSAPSARTWPPASCSGTTTDRTICPTTSRARSPSSASRLRRPSRQPGTASPSASSVHSRKTSCGCATSRPSRSCAWRCWISPPGTISMAGRPPWPPNTRSGQGRPTTGHGSGRMNDAAACLTTLVQYSELQSPLTISLYKRYLRSTDLWSFMEDRQLPVPEIMHQNSTPKLLSAPTGPADGRSRDSCLLFGRSTISASR